MLKTTLFQRMTLSQALKTFGKENQLKILIEELTELSLKVQHGIRKGFDNSEIQEEIADVFICLHYAIDIFGLEEIQKMVDYKINRLEKNIVEFEKSDY